MSNSGIIGAAIIVAMALIIAHDYYSIAGSASGGVYRLNNITGAISYCPVGMPCTPMSN
jgi:hypothetical protein